MLRFSLLTLMLTAVCLGAQAQQSQHGVLPDDKLPTAQQPDPNDPAQETRDEMMHRMEIKRDEDERKQNLEHAKESAQLSADLHNTYLQQKSLSQTDLKKLARLEKLAHQIRSDAGGSNDDEQLKDPPTDLAATLARLAARAEELRKEVEKTPPHVVSANTITKANEIIELVRLARSFVQ